VSVLGTETDQVIWSKESVTSGNAGQVRDIAEEGRLISAGAML